MNNPEPEMSASDFYREIIERLGPFKELRVNNHWVPVTYLKAFTNTGQEDGKFWMYDRKNPEIPKHVHPTAVAKQKYLYVLEQNMEVPDLVERMLDRYIERPFSLLRRKLIHASTVGMQPVLDSDQRLYLALFLAIQQGRTPFYRDRTQWLAAFHATFDLRVKLQDLHAVQRELRKSGSHHSLDEIRGWRSDVDAGKLEVGTGNEAWLASFLNSALEIASQAVDLPLRVVRATAGIEFPTSDMPVVVARRRDDEYSLGAGWMEAGAEITFSLDPQHVLVS